MIDKISIRIDIKLRRYVLKDILNPVQLAVLYSSEKTQEKGTQKILQKRLAIEGEDIAQSSISYWVKRGYVPYRLAEVISKITGVSAKELTKNNPHKKA